MKLTQNFWLREFKCNDGTEVPEELIDNVYELAVNLQVLRNYLGKPIHINSGYRSPNYNAKIGGAKYSQHKLAKAADIRVEGLTPKEVHKAILKLIKEGKMHNGGLGLYNTFVHYDVRPYAARWNG